jgi:ferredoxin
MGMKARVEKDLCIGCGLCAALSPEVFHMEDDGLAKAIEDELTEELLEGAREAEQQCPTEAIAVEEG